MNLALSHLSLLPLASDPVGIAPAQSQSPDTTAAQQGNETDSQTAPAFNDALLALIQNLTGGEQPRENRMVMVGVKADDEEEERPTEVERVGATTSIDAPQQLLDALLMASQMPVKTLNAAQIGVTQTGESLKRQNLSAGPIPSSAPMNANAQPAPLSLTPEPVLEGVKPTAVDLVKTLATSLPATAGQPTGVQTFTAAMEKQTVNLPPVKLDTSEAKWAQQLHSALNDRLQLQVRNQVQHATIRLDPPEMGKVDISLQIENGRMQVHISASNGETYRALQQISQELRQSLTEQNFVQVNVQVSTQSGQQQSGRGQQMPAQQNAPGAALEVVADDEQSTAGKDDSVLLTV